MVEYKGKIYVKSPAIFYLRLRALSSAGIPQRTNARQPLRKQRQDPSSIKAREGTVANGQAQMGF